MHPDIRTRLEHYNGVGDGDYSAYVRKGRSPLGEGEFGEVWKVERNGRYYAMKVPKSKMCCGHKDNHPYSSNLFRSELAIWAEMTDLLPEAVVRLFDCNIDPFPWVLMELAETDLRKEILAGTVGPSDVADILDQVQKIHECRISHMDLRPENILLVNGAWKISGLGASKTSWSPASPRGWNGVRYMAPEQILLSSKETDQRTDLWQMGMILYEVLIGGSPYGSDLDAFGTMEAIINGGPDLTDVPTEYRPVFKGALALRKEDRFSSATEFSKALRKVIGC